MQLPRKKRDVGYGLQGKGVRGAYVSWKRPDATRRALCLCNASCVASCLRCCGGPATIRAGRGRWPGPGASHLARAHQRHAARRCRRQTGLAAAGRLGRGRRAGCRRCSVIHGAALQSPWWGSLQQGGAVKESGERW